MIHGMFIRAGMAFAVLVSAAAAGADALPFSGTITGLGLASVDGTCPSPSSPAHGVLAASTSDGSATLGSSTYSHIGYDHDWCFSGPSGPISGTFNLYLGASTLFGSVTGMATPTTTMGVTDLDLTYDILGGTGSYLGASGSFGGIAVSNFVPGEGSHFSLNFLGSVNAPAVPEPSSWALLLLGFAMVGTVIRRQRRGASRQLGFLVG